MWQLPALWTLVRKHNNHFLFETRTFLLCVAMTSRGQHKLCHFSCLNQSEVFEIISELNVEHGEINQDMMCPLIWSSLMSPLTQLLDDAPHHKIPSRAPFLSKTSLKGAVCSPICNLPHLTIGGYITLFAQLVSEKTTLLETSKVSRHVTLM